MRDSHILNGPRLLRLSFSTRAANDHKRADDGRQRCNDSRRDAKQNIHTSLDYYDEFEEMLCSYPFRGARLLMEKRQSRMERTNTKRLSQYKLILPKLDGDCGE